MLTPSLSKLCLLFRVEQSALEILQLDFDSIEPSSLRVIHVEELIGFVNHVEIINEFLADCGFHFLSFFFGHFLEFLSVFDFTCHALFHELLLSSDSIHLPLVFCFAEFIERVECAEKGSRFFEDVARFGLFLLLVLFVVFLRCALVVLVFFSIFRLRVAFCFIAE